MASSKMELYDLSAKEREVLEWRSARRKILREQYLRQILHPTKQQVVFDDAVTRYGAMRLSYEFRAQLTGRSFILYFMSLAATAIGISSYIISVKDAADRQKRSGLVSYADRPVKIL